MWAAIRWGFGSLTRFSGRDSRGRFWPFALVAVFASMVVTGIPLSVVMVSMMRRMTEYVIENPGSGQVTVGPGHYSVSIEAGHSEAMPDMTAFFVIMGVMIVAIVALLAAAVVRRLHDTGRSGRWGLMPVPFLAYGLFAMSLIFSASGKTGDVDPMFVLLFMSGFLNNVAYMIALIWLIVLLCKSGTSGANRYGSQPPELF